MTLRTRNRLIVFSILAGPFIFLLGLLLFWEAEPLPPAPPLPNPNGYDDLVKAGGMITGDVGNYDEMREAELRLMAQSNSNALELARSGLRQKCQVALDYSPTLQAILVEHSALLHLAQAFATEGRLAEMENRTHDAIESDLDLIRLGNESAHGGVVVDQLVGMAIESLGVEQLHKLLDRLDAKSCRETAATLETLDSQRQTWDEVMQQERDWSRRAFPGIRYELVRLMERNSMQKINQHAEQQFDRRRSKTRLRMVDFAVRAYELDKGHPPASLADLVPGYLKIIPQDPLTGTNMVYPP